ncbi:ankyrin repeat-containing protein ITN1-like [Argentina anserina]|uniref:ankyrin repeat-containing protein ITN1-like n=1 Tax=Argentina anserina TaxID=57926 RepID=UPI0021765BBF|nr:ankyrin repeat-containing protein ITN1-like [Potentilla anserina]
MKNEDHKEKDTTIPLVCLKPVGDRRNRRRKIPDRGEEIGVEAITCNKSCQILSNQASFTILATDPSLYEAATSGDVGYLKRIRDGDDPIDLLSQRTPKDSNILHIAAEFKQIEFCHQVCHDDQYSQLSWLTNKKGDSPLHFAARVGCEEIVKLLIDRARKVDEENGAAVAGDAQEGLLEIVNIQEDTAVHVATRCGHHGVVSLLMAADPKLCFMTNTANESPLFLSTRLEFSVIASSILSECRIIPSFLGTNGVTALHVAVTHLDAGLVRSMVSKSPEMIREVDALGWTPLHYAAMKGHTVITPELLDGDSSACYILDKSGMSALHVAAYTGHTNVIEEVIRCRPDTCDLLNDKGQTILHVAVLGEQRSVVKYILKTPKLAGLTNEADEDGNTPLHLAAICENRKLVITLAHDRKVDKTAINNDLSKVVDILLGGSNLFKQDGRAPFASILLGNFIGVPFFHRKISSDFMNIKELGNNMSVIGDERQQLPEPGYSDEMLWLLKRFDTNMLVEILIATVTFAAVFTVPGGYKSDGTPVLQDKASFQVFLISNAFSFIVSIFVVFFNFLSANMYTTLFGVRGFSFSTPLLE